MAVVQLANEDKAAILLFTLSPETTEYVLSSLGPQRGIRLRRLMEICVVAPDLEELLSGVTQAFDDVMQRAIENANEPPAEGSAAQRIGFDGQRPAQKAPIWWTACCVPSCERCWKKKCSCLSPSPAIKFRKLAAKPATAFAIKTKMARWCGAIEPRWRLAVRCHLLWGQTGGVL